ncbi:MAG TPA: Rnase Y domain-containing protein, partial [Gemmatimonadaceae bacterium]|nr:Rnase Y domain-containing protein [Gemmatimonadaceae bacterium]
MNPLAYLAIALGVFGLAGTAVAVFFAGRKAGRAAEALARLAAGEAAEQVAKRIIGDAERDSEGLRKSAVLLGKEEAMRAREEWES